MIPTYKIIFLSFTTEKLKVNNRPLQLTVVHIQYLNPNWHCSIFITIPKSYKNLF